MSKKESRSLFSRIFKTDNNVTYGTTMKLLTGYQAQFTNFDNNLYENIDVRACIDAIARNGAKLSPKHIQNNGKGYKNVNSNLLRLLSEQPNELQNAYDFYYYIITELYNENDAFVYIARDENYKPLGLYPLHSGKYSFVEYKNELYIQFQFGSGMKHTCNIKDIIHLKRMASKDGLVGGSKHPIIKALSIKHVIDEGIVNAIKTTQSIRGVLKSTKAILKPEDVAKMRDKFVQDFVNNADGSGIGGLDATTDFKEINLNPTTATDDQVKSFDTKVLNYYGVSEEIIQSKYTENQWNAFYESILEPIAIQMGLEFTNKIFTLGEKNHGNKIIFTSNRLQYASNNTKIQIAKEMNNYLTINEIREIFNLEPVEDGDKRMQDLNHIDSTKANEYQVGATDNKNNEEGENKNE